MSERTVRKAARVVLVNPAGKVFMIHVRDIFDDSRTWWETPGGGAELGEKPRQTAVRELAEETGIECEPAELLGPLAQHRAHIQLSDGMHVQDEIFYGLVCTDDEDPENSLRTDLEKRAILETCWIPVDGSHVGDIRPTAVLQLAQLVAAGSIPDAPLKLNNGAL